MSDMGDKRILDIDRLSVTFPDAGSVIRDASLSINQGEIRGLVGESGSGKTMLARAIMGLLPPAAVIQAGAICFRRQDLLQQDADELRKLRGASIGMVFQEPMMSLNPAMRIGDQMAEAMLLHSDMERTAIDRVSLGMLERVRMPNPAQCLNAYPHEFSGGMRQRIMLASVMMLRPALLLADEPTTALDVLIQREIMEIMLEVVQDLGTAVLLITHDVGLIATYSHSVSVMRQGQILEQGTVHDTLMNPRHDYTRALLDALPRRSTAEPSSLEDSTKQAIVEVSNLKVAFSSHGWLPFTRRDDVDAVDGLTFDILRNETVAVVGESGSGKTTLGRAILRLVSKTAGSILVDGRDFEALSKKAQLELRRRMQIIFQDPHSSLDPRMRIGRIVGEGLRLLPKLGTRERDEKVRRVLKEVGIEPSWAERFPHELSGGQRQRVAIARAIIMEPMLIIADEAVSALDLTVQAQVLELLKSLQQRMGFSYLFISHDLGVVEQVADRIIVMYQGRVVEMGSREDIFDWPHHPYTCALLNAVPAFVGSIDEGFQLSVRQVEPPPAPDRFEIDFSFSREKRPPQELIEVSPGHNVAYSRSRL